MSSSFLVTHSFWGVSLAKVLIYRCLRTISDTMTLILIKTLQVLLGEGGERRKRRREEEVVGESTVKQHHFGHFFSSKLYGDRLL